MLKAQLDMEWNKMPSKEFKPKSYDLRLFFFLLFV